LDESGKGRARKETEGVYMTVNCFERVDQERQLRAERWFWNPIIKSREKNKEGRECKILVQVTRARGTNPCKPLNPEKILRSPGKAKGAKNAH